MHHFLYRESYLQLNQDSSLIATDFLKELSSEEKNILESTITLYKEEIHGTHFFFSDYMSAVSNYLKSSDKNLITPDNELLTPLVKRLNKFRHIYFKHFWPKHYKQNKSVLDQNLEIVKTVETPIASALSTLFKSPWQEEKIRVDISVYGALNRSASRDIPYSSIDPASVVMTSSGELIEKEHLWIELLFHEASHHLVLYNKGFVASTIAKASQRLDIKPPRGLWHAYLFYVAGKVTHQHIRKHMPSPGKMYMETFGVFSNLYPSLKELDLYINSKQNLEEVTLTILKETTK
jgi:hypothetical protein